MQYHIRSPLTLSTELVFGIIQTAILRLAVLRYCTLDWEIVYWSCFVPS